MASGGDNKLSSILVQALKRSSRRSNGFWRGPRQEKVKKCKLKLEESRTSSRRPLKRASEYKRI
jgi:hypothetical protein